MDKITIMVVEDHTIVRQGIVSLINQEKDLKVVAEASDGRQAIRLFKVKKPAVVIMDLSMPNLNGLEATRIIRKKHPDSKIIALSMYSDEEYILKAINVGVAGYLIKKNAAEDIIRAISAVHEGKAFFSPEISRAVMDSYQMIVRKLKSKKNINEMKTLTSRELEVLQLIAEGHTSRTISQELFISINTVQKHRERIIKKTGIHDVAGLTRYAMEQGIIEQIKPKI